MARPLPAKRAAARPLPGPTEAAIREQARRDALDEADRTMLATLITLDRRQQEQGATMISMARDLAEVVAWVRDQRAVNGHVDPLAATVAAVNGEDR